MTYMPNFMVALLTIAASCPAAAKTESVLFSSGDWELIGVDGFEMNYFGENYVLDGICSARTRNDTGSVELAMFYREYAEFAPEIIGTLFGRIEILGKQFEASVSEVTLVSGSGSYTVTFAEYINETIPVCRGGTACPGQRPFDLGRDGW